MIWDDGRTLREHLEAAEKSSGRTPDRLVSPPIPLWFVRQFQIWLDLHQGRSSNGFGLASFSWMDIDAYCRVTGEVLIDADLQLVRAIETEFQEVHAKNEERRRTKSEVPSNGK